MQPGNEDEQHATALVVAGVDGSELALDAVRWAAREADARGVSLRLVSAMGHRSEYGYGPRRSLGNIYDAVVSSTQLHLNAAASAARLSAPNVDVGTRMRTGQPSAVLVAQSAGARLLVVGHRGWGGMAGLFGGSVAERVAATARCPVVVVREPSVPEPPGPPRPVVVGVDGSELSEAAIAFSFEQAQRWRAPLVAVHSWLDRTIDPSIAHLVDWDAVRTEEEALLAQRLAGWSEKYPDVTVSRVVARDRPAHALLERAERARLLVVGSRGRSGLAGATLGSVSRSVVSHARCPVVVVRPEPGGGARNAT